MSSSADLMNHGLSAITYHDYGGRDARTTSPKWKPLQQQYPNNMAYFLMSALAFFTLIHVFTVARRLLRPRSSQQVLADIEGCKSRPQKLSWRRFPSAIASTFRIVAFRLPVPLGFGFQLLGAELFIIVIYLCALFIWTLIDTDNLTINAYNQRAGFMAVAQLPFIIGLAGKNNVISFLTGISHEKLNVFHRATSRACVILLWIHFFGNYIPGLSPKHDFTNDWVRAGAVGLGGVTLATVLSLSPIRRKMYEFFLVTHIVLVLVFLIGGWYHLAHFRKPTARWMDYYMWPGFLLWGLDRIVRFGKTIWNNSIWSSTKRQSTGTIEVLSSDTLRLTLRRRISWTPGQHAYVILPSVSSLPTEAHPFTIASIPGSLDGSSDTEEKDLQFIVRSHGGFTQRLLVLGQKGRREVPAFIDGPYGSPPDLAGFSTVVLIAGGSGVSYTLPMLLNLVRLANKKRTVVRRIVFVWVIRHTEHMNWVSDSLVAAIRDAPSDLEIKVHIHATSASTDTVSPETAPKEAPSMKSSIEEKPSSLYSTGPDLPVIHGRPDIRNLLDGEIDAATGLVSVDVCGPLSLSDSVRGCLRFEAAGGLGVLKGRAPVVLHVEKFGM